MSISCGGNLNVVGDVSLNSLDLFSSSTGQFTTGGNFCFVKNNGFTAGTENSSGTYYGNEYGTIVIGPIQIKFGYTNNNVGTIYFSQIFPSSFLTGYTTTSGTGTGGAPDINGYSNTEFFYPKVNATVFGWQLENEHNLNKLIIFFKKISSIHQP
jgi:hypothetical protein